jgi:hypothetical protein
MNMKRFLLVLLTMLILTVNANATTKDAVPVLNDPNFFGLACNYDGSTGGYHLRMPVGIHLTKYTGLKNLYLKVEPVMTAVSGPFFGSMPSFKADYLSVLLGYKLPMPVGWIVIEGGAYYRTERDASINMTTITNVITNTITDTITNNTETIITDTITNTKKICKVWCLPPKITETTKTDRVVSPPTATTGTESKTETTSTTATENSISTEYVPSQITYAFSVGWYIHW